MRVTLKSNLSFEEVAMNFLLENGYYATQLGTGAGFSYRPEGGEITYPKQRCDVEGWEEFQEYLKRYAEIAKEAEMVQWTTSAGNILQVQPSEDGCVLTATGRRHGIPWWLLPTGWHNKVFSWEYESSQREDLAPWETTT